MDWGNDRYNKIQSSEDDYVAIVKEIFKIAILHIGSNSSSIGTLCTNMKISFPEENKYLIGSDYFLNEKNNIIHFTSLKALFSIINERSLRLYNLNNSNDPKEYNYAARHIAKIYENQGFTKELINEQLNVIKTNAFILSFTETKEIYNPKFWELYADGGRGVAIEFEIMNDPLKWENFYYSKVKYGELVKIKTLIIKVINHQANNLNNTYNLDLHQFFGLHKSNIDRWKKENEIRIITYNSFINEYMKQIYRDVRIEKNGLIETMYYKLPLFNNNSPEENKDQRMPDLKIAKIYFGPNINYPSIFPNSGFNDFKNELWHYIYKYFGKILDYKDLIDINEFTRKNNL